MEINLQTKLPKIEAGMIKSQQGAIVEIVLLLVGAGLLYWFLVQPKLVEVKAKQAQLEQVRSQKESVERDAKVLQALSRDLAAKAAEIDHLDQALPLSERQVRTQLLIEQLTRSSGVLIGNISVTDGSESVTAGNSKLLTSPYSVPRSLRTVTVGMNVSGTFSQLVDLIGKLERYGRLMDISSLAFASDTQNTGFISMKLDFTTYYYGAK